MEQKKIVFFTGSMGRGGAERVISILSDHFVCQNWDVTIVMLLHDRAGGYTLNDKVKVKTFFPENSGMVKKIICNIRNIRSYIKKTKPDVLVSFMAQNTLVSGIACAGLGIRYIASERIDPSMVKRNFIYKKILNSLYRRADKVIFQTERAKNYFGEKIKNNSVIIGNPISVEFEATQTNKKIVSAGRFTQQKNQKMLIDAFSMIVKKHPEYVLEIYGEGKERQNLEKQISELGLEDCVFLPGNKKNLHECIKDAQIFVLPSNFEGLSNALLEAMMMGLACVSTDCAGSDEVIISGENGLLVPVGNKEELETAIVNLIEDKKLREQIARNGKKSVEKFRAENIVSKWIEVIEGE